MSEIEKLLIDRKQEIVQLAEGLGVENIDEIVELITATYNKLPTSRIFTPEKKFTRALAFVCADLAPQDGREKVEIAILGYTRPKDWNKGEYDKIMESWQKGAVSQQKLIDEWKVMRIKTRDGNKAVYEIEELDTDDKKVPHVIKGKIITGDEEPIPRDSEKKGGKGEKTWVNKHYGYPLGTKWALNIYGLTHDGEKDIRLEGNLYSNYDGDWATPGTEDFLLSKAPAFGFYDATVVIDQEKSTDDKMVIKSIGAIAAKKIMITEEQTIVKDDGSTAVEEVDKELEFLEYIYGVMEGTDLVDEDGNECLHAPIRDFKEYLAAEDETIANELLKSWFMVESSDYEEFHYLYRKLDKDGNNVVSKNGSNYCDWGAFGLSVAVCKQIKETKNGNDQLVLVGTAGKMLNAFMPEEHPKLTLENPSECLISFNTVKKGTRYDKDTKKQVKDSVNGDVQINNILGYLATFELID